MFEVVGTPSSTVDVDEDARGASEGGDVRNVDGLARSQLAADVFEEF